MADNNLLLEVSDLKVHFFTDEGVVRAVDKSGALLVSTESGSERIAFGELIELDADEGRSGQP